MDTTGRYHGRKLPTVFAGLFSVLLLCGHAQTAGAVPPPQYVNTCGDCHGTNASDIRPIDTTTFRNVTTGAFVGSHSTHMAPTASPTACEKCHTGASFYPTGHMDDLVAVSANINSSPAGNASYRIAGSPVTFFNRTSIPVMGSCTNVNCHFEQTTPLWAASPFNNAATTDCNKCHGAPPGVGGGVGTAGSHVKHDAYFTGATKCNLCHADHLAEVNRFTHATSAAHASIQVQLHDPAGTAGGSYSGSGTNFLPSQSGSQSFGNCTNLYCHSQGKSDSAFGGANAPKSAATWGGALAANCAGCHGGIEASADDIATNAHPQHIVNAAAVGRNIGCQECHNATTTDGSSIASTSVHVNKGVNIKFTGINGSSATYDGNPTSGVSGAAKTPGAVLGSGCATLYCHSDGHPVAGSRTYRTPAWNGAAIGCNGCHGTGNAASNAFPDHGSAGTGVPGSNSHVKHSDATNGYSITCIKCHNDTVANATNTVLKTTSSHLDGAGSVAFDASAGPSANYTAATQTCSLTYCHSNGNGTNVTNPIWGETSGSNAKIGDCTYCHGNNVSSATTIGTNKHAAHINNVAVLGTNQNLSCTECHAATISADRTISNKTRHVNGFKDFSGVRAYRTGFSGGSCTTYCHSSGQATPAYRNMTGSKAWSGPATLGCTGCHGYGVKPFAAFTSVAGEPNYTSGAAGSPTANTHRQHVRGRGISDSRGCTDCHRLTVDQSVAGKLKNYSSLHLDGQRNVNFAPFGNVTGHYTAASKTCSNTYCHPSIAATWGGAPLTCDGCHYANSTLAAGHKIHWETATVAASYVAAPGNSSGDATKYQFECSSCHNSSRTPGSTHANGPVTAGVQVGEVYFGYTTATVKGAYVAGAASAGKDGALDYTAGNGTSCQTSYCHSNGNGGAGAAPVLWTTTSKTAAATSRCVKCHNYTKATTPIISNGHNRHVNDYTIGCSRCHYATTTDSTSIADSRKHVNKIKDVVWDAAADGGTPYSAPNCSNIYCHSQGTKFTSGYTAADVAPNSAATWTGSMPADCSGCHDGAATGPGYATGSPKSNSHDVHVQIMKFRCYNCHASVVSDVALPTAPTITDKSLHANKAYNLLAGGKMGGATGADVTFTPTAGSPGSPSTCNNVSCHNNYALPWGAPGPIPCVDCHTINGADVENFTGYNGTHAKINSAQWTTTGHGLASSSQYASGNSGANFAAVYGNQCVYCHDQSINHRDATNFFRLANYSTTTYGRNAPCLICHGKTAPGRLDIVGGAIHTRLSSSHYGAGHTGTAGGGYFCWDCHDPHGDTNAYMIHDQVAKTSDRATGKPLTFAAVSFTGFSSGGNYAGAGNRICNACHTTAGHYTASSSDGHNIETRCTTCHSHSGPTAITAFRPNGNCDSCHGYPPVRRDLVKGVDFRKQGVYSSGRFQDYTGGGGAHTIAKHLAPTVKASDGWAPCAVCHSNGSLTPAFHFMSTPVRPNANITIDVKDSRKFDYRRSLGQERYTGARLTGDKATNRTGSCSNVNCHFKPSKRWSNSR